MKYAYWLVLGLLVLMSLAAGGAKLAAMPQEVAFFADAGIDAKWLLPLGLVQIVAGLLAILPRTRSLGAASMALGFLISSAVIFMTGNIGFGLVSLLPVLLSGLIAHRERRAAV